MPIGNIEQALTLASQYAFDETHGYLNGGTGYPDFDCSGFVGRCLHEAGFNYPASHIGTWNMTSLGDGELINAGFIEHRYTDLNPVPLEHGDIVVMNHTLTPLGHTFFYATNYRAYTDPNADSDNIGIVSEVKIEASSSRGNTNSGDSRKNGTGAYWEVWCHAFYNPFYNGYNPSDPNDYIHVYKYPYKDIDKQASIVQLLMSLPTFIYRKRKRGLI